MLTNDEIDVLAKPIEDEDEEYELAVLLLIISGIVKIKKARSKSILSVMARDKALVDLEALTSKHKFSVIAKTKEIIRNVGRISYQEAVHSLKSPSTNVVRFEDNERVQQIIKDTTNETIKAIRKSVTPQAFMLRDPNNPNKLIPTSLSQTYSNVIGNAINAATNQSVDFDTLMRDIIKQLNASGIRSVSYSTETGKMYPQRLDTAVRRNLLDGIRNVHQNIQFEMGEQMGADGIQLSVHRYPAIDHAPVQGHLFTMEQFNNMQTGLDFEDIDKQRFDGFPRAIGTLNCKHFAYAIKLGVTKPTYTKKQLQAILNENERGYTMPNGKHLTMYECTQYMRRLECDIRRDKDGLVLAKKLGDEVLCNQYQASISNKTKKYYSFCKACHLLPQKDRIKSYL